MINVLFCYYNPLLHMFNVCLALNQTLENRTAALDASKATITELENLLVKKDAMIADVKRLLKVTKDEYHEQLEVCILLSVRILCRNYCYLICNNVVSCLPQKPHFGIINF